MNCLLRIERALVPRHFALEAKTKTIRCGSSALHQMMRQNVIRKLAGRAKEEAIAGRMVGAQIDVSHD
jgi:hypothetical protein